MLRPYRDWLSEDYYIFTLSNVPGQPRGSDLLTQQGPQIAQILRGELFPLARQENDDVLQASLSYYPNDLVVVGWNAALVYDTPAGVETSVQILEYVNSQLLEFRHYDELLTRELAGVYTSLKHHAGILAALADARRGLAAEQHHHRSLRPVERSDTAIKFVCECIPPGYTGWRPPKSAFQNIRTWSTKSFELPKGCIASS